MTAKTRETQQIADHVSFLMEAGRPILRPDVSKSFVQI